MMEQFSKQDRKVKCFAKDLYISTNAEVSIAYGRENLVHNLYDIMKCVELIVEAMLAIGYTGV